MADTASEFALASDGNGRDMTESSNAHPETGTTALFVRRPIMAFVLNDADRRRRPCRLLRRRGPRTA